MLEKATEEEIKRTKTEADKQEAADSKVLKHAEGLSSLGQPLTVSRL